MMLILLGHFVRFGHFVPLDILSHQAFCPFRHFVSLGIMSFGHFILLGIFSYLDKMSFRHFVHGHYVICGHFVTLGISSYNLCSNKLDKICLVYFWTDSSNYIALLGLVLDVLSAKPSVIIHEHDENSWQRLFTVLSHNKKKLKSHQLLSLLYYLLQSDLEKIKLHAVFFQVVLYNYYIVLLLLNMVCQICFFSK